MAQVLVRNLDDKVVEALKSRAQRSGHSLEQELRSILTDAVKPDRQTLIEVAARSRAATRVDIPFPDSTELIRRDRDSR